MPLSESTLQALREMALPLVEEPSEAGRQVQVVRFGVPGPKDAPEVDVIVYRPPQSDIALPCIFHIHGGGYILGKAGQRDAKHRDLAAGLHCAIVTVDYRLAPETPFPGPIDDCYAALQWLFAEAANLGIDAARIGVMGESAGGGLAAALALMVRDRNEHNLTFQHLIYPMLDDRTGASGSPHPLAGEFIWTAQDNAFAWGALLGGKPGGEPGLDAVGISDGEDKCLGIPQPDAAAPHRRYRQDQCQCGKQQHLSAIARHQARTRGWSGRWHFSTHGSYPQPGASPPCRRRGSPERDRKYLKKNNNFQV